jgi:hypothetical protein
MAASNDAAKNQAKQRRNSMSVQKIVKSESAEKWLRVLIATATIFSLVFIGFVTPVTADGAVQISGSADLTGPGCEARLAELGATYAAYLEGDLIGCQFVFVESGTMSPSGTYREEGTEYYEIVGGLFGIGTFKTEYVFTGKFAPTGAEIFGRCQHPIVAGSGDGAFTGVSGRLDFKDFPEINYFPYTGHMRW